VKTKQASASLLSEKHLLQKQLHQVNSSLESSKQKIGRSEEQVTSELCPMYYFICCLPTVFENDVKANIVLKEIDFFGVILFTTELVLKFLV
jgi:hypothetical protein